MENKNEVKTYTEADIKALEDWVNQLDMEGSMQLDSAVFIPDIKDTLSRLVEQAWLSYDNPKLHGCIRLLEQIKNKVEQEKGE